MSTITRTPFWVPRPSDDLFWQAAPMGASLNLLAVATFFGAKGQAPTKRWLPYYSYNVGESQWNAAPVDSPIIAFLTKQVIHGKGGQVPTKKWAPYLTIDDPPPWQMPSEWMNSGVMQELTRVPFNLFTPFLWRLNYTQNDPPGWQGSPDGSPITLTVVTQNPFVPQFPEFIDDPPPWQMPSEWMNSGVMQQLARITFPLFTPYLWRTQYTQNDASCWQGEPVNSAIIQLLTAAGQAKPFQWNYTLDDQGVWTGSPDGAPLTLTAATQNPFKGRAPNWCAEDPVWSGEPVNSAAIQLLTAVKFYGAGGQVPTFTFRFGLDDPTVWSGEPINSATIQLLTAPGKVKPFRWNYTLDDASGWSKNSSGSAIISILTAGGKPPTPHYQLHSDDASFWQGGPVSVYPYLSAVQPPVLPEAPFSPFYVPRPPDDNIWQQLIRFNQPLNTVFGNPFTIRQPITYFEDSLWTWQARRSSAISMLTVGGKVKPFRANFTYDDSASWVPTVRENLILLSTKIGQPFNLSSQWFNAAMFYNVDAPGWVGKPLPTFTSGVPGPPIVGKFEWIIRARRRGRR